MAAAGGGHIACLELLIDMDSKLTNGLTAATIAAREVIAHAWSY